jgi:hypothetical protein
MNTIVKQIYVWMLSTELWLPTQGYKVREATSLLVSLKLIKKMNLETKKHDDR